MIFNITKRNGSVVAFDMEKIAAAVEKHYSPHPIMIILLKMSRRITMIT
jgi:hypothetical protein